MKFSKINKICKKKFTKLLISETETSSDNESIYSINEIEDSNDSSSESQEYSDNLCMCKQINFITKNDKQILLEIIDKIEDPEIKKEYLLKLKEIVTKEEKFTNPETYNLNRILEKYPTQSLFKQITTRELQTEIKQVKTQIRELQTIVNQQALKQLEFDAKLALIQSNKPSSSTPNETPFQEPLNVSQEDYIQNIEKINYQKWYIKITLHVGKDFKTNIIALLDTGADQNCIREGIIPSKYYEKTSERLSGAGGNNLIIKYKLHVQKYAIMDIVLKINLY